MWDSLQRLISSGVPRHQGHGHHQRPFRAQINDPVRGFDDVQVVLDDDDGVAPIPQLVQYLEQLLDIVEVQPRGRFVQDVEGLAGVPLGELRASLTRCASPPESVVAD